MHILKKTLIFSVLICGLGLNAHSAVDDDPLFPCDHLHLIFSPQASSDLVYHTLAGEDLNNPINHVLTLRINNPVRTAPDIATECALDIVAAKRYTPPPSKVWLFHSTMLLCNAHYLVGGQPYFRLSHIINQLISYHGTSEAWPATIADKYVKDWLRSASIHAEVPLSIKSRILTTIESVPVSDEASSSSAAD